MDLKMWGMAQMTASGVNWDIRFYDKSAHLLICPPVKKVFFTEFRQTSPVRLFSQCVMTGCIHPMCIYVLRTSNTADRYSRRGKESFPDIA
jgi:hypothetical protein